MRLSGSLIWTCFLALGLVGCVAGPAGQGSMEDSRQNFEYISRIEDPQAKAYYYFTQAIMLHNQGDLEGVVAALGKTLEVDSSTPGIRLYLAEVLLQLNRDEEAIRYLEDVIIEDPDSVQAYRLLGEVLFEKGRLADSIRAFRELVKLLPEDEDPILLLVQALSRNGNSIDAIETLKQYLSGHGGSYRGHYALARLYRQIGLSSSAEQSYKKVLELQPKLLPAYLELGKLLESKESVQAHEQAMALYRDGLKVRPDDPGLRHRLVRLLLITEQYASAKEQLEEILSSNPDDQEALRKYGLLLMELEDWPNAARSFEHLLNLTDDRDPVRYYLGNVYESSAQPYEALREFLQITSQSELYPDARIHAAYLYRMLEEGKQSYQVLLPLIDHPGLTVDHLLLMTSLASEAGFNNEALQIFQRGEGLFPGNTKIVYQKGTLLEKMGMREASRKAMQEVLELDPYHSEALNFIAYQYAEEGVNLDQALTLVRRAIELNEAGHIYDTLGWVLYRMQRYSEALEAMLVAVQKLPDDPTIQEHLGDIYLALGKRSQARKSFEKALELDPENTQIGSKLENLQ